MDGIEKITGRIAADTEAEIASIQAEARRQADEITARYEAQAKREELASLLLPVETAFAHLPALSLSAHFARLFANGVRLRAEQVGSPQPGEYRVFGPDGFLGVALQDGGQLRIKRLFLGGR